MHILITGGSGLVGTHLTAMLMESGHKVSHLSRRKSEKNGVRAYKWDLVKGTIEDGAFNGVHAIVHLAGAGVADKRWTSARKQEILDSRYLSGRLLEKELKERKHEIKVLISASGMGYYGDCGDKSLIESDPPGDDFLAKVCIEWEAATDGLEAINIRRVLLRIGLVLDKKGGALAKMALPAKMGIGSYFGNGKQIYSWLHINDLSKMILHAIENENVQGPYNAIAPQTLSNYDFSKKLNKVLGRPFIPFPAPSFALKLALGEMANALLFSINVSSAKIEKTGFEFEFPELESALKAIYK